MIHALGCIVDYGRLLFLCCTRLKDFDLVDLVKTNEIHTKFTRKSLVEVSDLFEVAQGVESIITIYYSTDSLNSVSGV